MATDTLVKNPLLIVGTKEQIEATTFGENDFAIATDVEFYTSPEIDEKLDLKADKSIESTISTHIDDKENPHSVTAEQIGLGNVDNTSDLDKPISTATQEALDLKANADEYVKKSGDTMSSSLYFPVDGKSGIRFTTDNVNINPRIVATTSYKISIGNLSPNHGYEDGFIFDTANGVFYHALNNFLKIGRSDRVVKNIYTASINNGADLAVPTEAGTLARLEDIPVVETLPNATEDNASKIYQYVGSTTDTLTQGYFYKNISSLNENNEIVYNWEVIQVQPTPDPLPDQTDNAGKFLTTDGTTTSWAKALVNTADEDTKSLAIGGTATPTEGSIGFIAIGADSSATSNSASMGDAIAIGRSAEAKQEGIALGGSSNAGGRGGIALGMSTKALAEYSTSVGYKAESSGINSTALGANAKVASNANYAVQIGEGTNSDANTLKVANINGNFELMSPDGSIPAERLALDGTAGQVLTLSNNGMVWADGALPDNVVSTINSKTGDVTLTAGDITVAADNNITIKSALESKADASNVYTKSEVDAKVSSVLKFKGSVATKENLPTEGMVVGDVYNVEADGSNYAWDGSNWDKLSETVDLSGYLSKNEAATTYAPKSIENSITENATNLSNHINNKTNPHSVTKAQVGLGNVDNTSDIDKPISFLTQEALDLKADKETTYNKEEIGQLLSNKLSTDTASTTYAVKSTETDLSDHTTNVSNPHNVTKAQVGLSNVDNTSDIGKPISNATQLALNKKADKDTVYSKDDVDGLLDNKLGVEDAKTIYTTFDDLNTHATAITNPHKVTKDQVGLGNVNNTSDIDKPISNATQAALNQKADKDTVYIKDDVDGLLDKKLDILVADETYAKASNLTTHINNKTNPHNVTKAQVGLGNVDNTSDLNKPISTSTQAALDLKANQETTYTKTEVDSLVGSKLNSATASSTYATIVDVNKHVNDESNPHEVTKAQVGLGNVDNTSDLNKPISTATQTALNLKANVSDVYTKSEVDAKVSGLYKFKGSVETEADLPKSGNITGDTYNITSTGANYTWDGSSWDKLSETIDLSPYLTIASAQSTYATAANVKIHTDNTSNPHKVTKAQVGLGNVDNTSDANKPISTATQAALDLKANQSTTYTKTDTDVLLNKKLDVDTASTTYAVKSTETTVNNHISNKSNPHSVTKAQVGLGNVDNTSDLSKPVSTATQNALDLKANKSEIPTKVSQLSNDSGYVLSSNIGNGTVTIVQNGVTKGTFTLNQSGNTTITLTDNDTKFTATYDETNNRITFA